MKYLDYDTDIVKKAVYEFYNGRDKLDNILHKYKISRNVFYHWKRKLNINGKSKQLTQQMTLAQSIIQPIQLTSEKPAKEKASKYITEPPTKKGKKNNIIVEMVSEPNIMNYISSQSYNNIAPIIPDKQIKQIKQHNRSTKTHDYDVSKHFVTYDSKI